MIGSVVSLRMFQMWRKDKRAYVVPETDKIDVRGDRFPLAWIDHLLQDVLDSMLASEHHLTGPEG